ncbi:hypothetical protein ACFOOM_10880 [Streptomyces echinoruber]|uniref:Uncharacterized protein n=1 Tax=Streptomyces echinoruber TaxID=68898 RepID=A0A918RVZ1_9ACTN|nr:hypothetical protein [Streptomyces echinoruber]GHA14616.1 hypothetical protein GCM10010389_61670 [Streptomyces echinoruber]
MKSFTASAHLEPDSTSRVSVFDATEDSGPFVSLRIGGQLVDLALIARPGTASALRALARAADEAASALDRIADSAADGDA